MKRVGLLRLILLASCVFYNTLLIGKFYYLFFLRKRMMKMNYNCKRRTERSFATTIVWDDSTLVKYSPYHFPLSMAHCIRIKSSSVVGYLRSSPKL